MIIDESGSRLISLILPGPSCQESIIADQILAFDQPMQSVRYRTAYFLSTIANLQMCREVFVSAVLVMFKKQGY